MIEKIKELREISGAGIMDVKKALEVTDGDIDKAIVWLRENGIVKAAKKTKRIAAEGSVFIATSDDGAALIELNSETDYVASNEQFVKAGNEITKAVLKAGVTNVKEVLKLEIDGETIGSYITNLTAIIGEKITLRRVSIYKGTIGSYQHANSRIGVLIQAENMDQAVLRDIAMQIAAMNPKFLSMDDISEGIIKYETDLAKKELAQAIEGKPEKVVEGMINGKVTKGLSESVLLEQSFVKDSSKKVKDLQGSGKILDFTRFEVGEGIEKKEENFAEEVAKQMGQ